MEPLKEIGSKIKFYRIQKHMTIKDLAESICKSQATLYKYEKGQIALDLSVLYDIASALSIPVTALLYEPPLPKKEMAASIVPAFFSGLTSFCAYTYDGRQKKIRESLIECIQKAEETDSSNGLIPSPFLGEGSYLVKMYMNLLQNDNEHLCEDSYLGHMVHFGAITNFIFQNCNARLDQYMISVPSPYIDSETKWGLAFGISSRPLMPTAGKVLLSKVRIPKTKEFAKSLILTKEDYRLMKLYNYMVVV